MKTQIKVGDVFRVFRIEDDVYRMGDLGKWTIEKNGRYHGNEFGVSLYVNHKFDHFGCDKRKEVKCVGRLTITKVKRWD